MKTKLITGKKTTKDLIRRDKYLLILIAFPALYFLIFHYIPMLGLVISFQDYLPGKGLFGSEWVGFKWFIQFFNSIYFYRLIRNTFLLALLPLLIGSPITILFAVIVPEIRGHRYRKTVQMVSYIPYFISTVVVAGMFIMFLSPNDGIVNNILHTINGTRINFLTNPRYFRGIYTTTVIWQGFGFSAIVFIAAIMAINPELYESAKIDGASKFREVYHVTLPGILPTIIVTLLLNIGRLMTVGFERVYLLSNPSVLETADVIATYVYRRGILYTDFGFATAVGLFNSIINFTILFIANKLARKYAEMSLW